MADIYQQMKTASPSIIRTGQIAERTGFHRRTVGRYLHRMADAGLIALRRGEWFSFDENEARAVVEFIEAARRK